MSFPSQKKHIKFTRLKLRRKKSKFILKSTELLKVRADGITRHETLKKKKYIYIYI